LFIIHKKLQPQQTHNIFNQSTQIKLIFQSKDASVAKFWFRKAIAYFLCPLTCSLKLSLVILKFCEILSRCVFPFCCRCFCVPNWAENEMLSQNISGLARNQYH